MSKASIPLKSETSCITQVVALTLLLSARAFAEAPTTAPAAATQATISIETRFSPADEIASSIVKLIDAAERSVDIAAFSFTHPDIADAAVRAHQRGVKVPFLMDYTQSRLKSCRAEELLKAGIEVRTRHRRGFQHNKYIVIDLAIVLSGSYNFTSSADDRNTENLLIIRNAPQVVKSFSGDYQTLRADSLVKK